MAIKKITNVFDHVSGEAQALHAMLAGQGGPHATSQLPGPLANRSSDDSSVRRCPPPAVASAFSRPIPLPSPPNSTHTRTLTRLHTGRPHTADATRILREIKLLRLLRHPDIVEIKHIMLPPSARDFKDIYVVFELMETDLHQVGSARPPPPPSCPCLSCCVFACFCLSSTRLL